MNKQEKQCKQFTGELTVCDNCGQHWSEHPNTSEGGDSNLVEDTSRLEAIDHTLFNPEPAEEVDNVDDNKKTSVDNTEPAAGHGCSPLCELCKPPNPDTHKHTYRLAVPYVCECGDVNYEWGESDD